MYLEPKNRHLLVLPLDEREESQSLIVLPDGYEPEHSAYVACDVLGKSEDCSVEVDIGDRIIIERRMLCEVKAGGERNLYYWRAHTLWKKRFTYP